MVGEITLSVFYLFFSIAYNIGVWGISHCMMGKLDDLSLVWVNYHYCGHGLTHWGSDSQYHLGGCGSADSFSVGFLLYHANTDVMI